MKRTQEEGEEPEGAHAEPQPRELREQGCAEACCRRVPGRGGGAGRGSGAWQRGVGGAPLRGLDCGSLRDLP